jgi:hypothetical protein
MRHDEPTLASRAGVPLFPPTLFRRRVATRRKPRMGVVQS